MNTSGALNADRSGLRAPVRCNDAMAEEFPEVREKPEPAKERQVKRNEPDIADDFDLGM